MSHLTKENKMTNKELQQRLNKVGLNQSDLARAIYDTKKLTTSQRVMINRYWIGKVKIPHWLPKLLEGYITKANEQRFNTREISRST